MNDLSELVKECGPLTEVSRPNYEALAKARELGDLGFNHLAKEIRDRVLLAQKMEEVAKEKYTVITPKSIQGFLNRKAEAYDKKVAIFNEKVAAYNKKAAAFNEKVMKTSSEVLRGTMLSMMNTLSSNTSWSGDGSIITTTSTGGVTFDTPVPTLPSRFVAMTHDFLSPAKDRIAGFAWAEVPVREYKAVPPESALQALRIAKEKEIFHDFCIASVTHVEDPLLLGVLNGSEDRYFLAAWGNDIPLDDVI